MASPLEFELPPEAEATSPPESRGIARDGVRLLVARPQGMEHRRFADIVDALDPGDVLVVNDSGTLPAAVDGRGNRGDVTVHFSGPVEGAAPGVWVLELRPGPRATHPVTDAVAGDQIELPGGVRATLVAGYPDGGATSDRLWTARVAVEGDVAAYLRRHGRPIRYAYVEDEWPISAYQTVFAREPGSAEMPSAGRPFTAELVTALVSKGVTVAPITLRTGVSSAESGEPPVPERYVVPAPTADLVNLARRTGRRVVAVGTTVTRALETVANERGHVSAGGGWTSLVLGADRPARVVDGLVTGWHAPGASHLDLLEAVAGPDLVRAAYAEAIRYGYLWHEFGDSCLLLPERRPASGNVLGVAA